MLRHRYTEELHVFVEDRLYVSPHTTNIHTIFQPLEAPKNHLLVLISFVSLHTYIHTNSGLFWRLRMGPIRGLKRKERAEEDIIEEDESNGDPSLISLPSQPQSFDSWWDRFSKRFTGMYYVVYIYVCMFC